MCWNLITDVTFWPFFCLLRHSVRVWCVHMPDNNLNHDQRWSIFPKLMQDPYVGLKRYTPLLQIHNLVSDPILFFQFQLFSVGGFGLSDTGCIWTTVFPTVPLVFISLTVGLWTVMVTDTSRGVATWTGPQISGRH